MPPPSEFRLPPLRIVLVFIAVFAVLSHFSAVHHSTTYSARVSSIRDKLGLGSDGMPLGARVRLGQAAAEAGHEPGKVLGGGTAAEAERLVSDVDGTGLDSGVSSQSFTTIGDDEADVPRTAGKRNLFHPRPEWGPVGYPQEHARHGG